MDEASYDALVLAIYDVASDPACVPEMLRRLCEAMGAHAATLGVQDLGDHHLHRMAVGTPPEMAAACHGYFRYRNPFLQAASRRPAGSVLVAEELLEADAMRRDEYVQDYLCRFDVPRILAIKLEQERHTLVTLNVMRGMRQEAFGAAERRLARRLAPHLRGALALRRQLGWGEQVAEAQGERLAALGTATVLLDRDGRPTRLGATTAALLEHGGAVRAGPDRLHARDPRMQAALTALLDRATRGDAGGRQGGALSLPREAGRPVSVLVAPVGPGAAAALSGRPAAVVTLTDPDARGVPSGAQLSRLFGLTGSEAAVARRLAAGRTLAEAAAELGLTAGTARQYLQRVFHKTDVTRQSELVRLVAGLGEG